MSVASAVEFLAEFAAEFDHEDVRSWQWEGEDDLFGKRVSWPLGRDELIDAIATVELMENQLQLTITEREIATSSESASEPSGEVVFSALIQFEDGTVAIDGEFFPYAPASISEAIRAFNERS